MRIDPTPNNTPPHPFDTIHTQIKQVFGNASFTNKQAHNISECIILISLVKSEMEQKPVLEIYQYIIDICAHITANKNYDESRILSAELIVANLVGDPKLILKIQRFFDKIFRNLRKIDSTLRIMNLTSVILRHKEDSNLFNSNIKKYL
jgi:hypothetical protein